MMRIFFFLIMFVTITAVAASDKEDAWNNFLVNYKIIRIINLFLIPVDVLHLVIN